MKSENEIWELLDKICAEKVRENESLTNGIGRNSEYIKLEYARIHNNRLFRAELEVISMNLLRRLTRETIDNIINDLLAEMRGDA